jgi:hypothetical protein
MTMRSMLLAQLASLDVDLSIPPLHSAVSCTGSVVRNTSDGVILSAIFALEPSKAPHPLSMFGPLRSTD